MSYGRLVVEGKPVLDSADAQDSRRTASLKSLEAIYYVVAGLAISDACEKTVELLQDERWEAIDNWHVAARFLLFLTFAVRFIHGASTVFGNHSLVKVKSGMSLYQKLQVLWDFAAFGVQALIFVLIASTVHKEVPNAIFLFALLIWDTVWIAVTLHKDVALPDLAKATMRQWVRSNAWLVLFMTFVIYARGLDLVGMLWGSVLALVAGTVAMVWDYWANRAFYFSIDG